MHICYIIHSLQQGGAENFLLSLIQELPSELDASVCTLGGDTTLQPEFQSAGVQTINLDLGFPYDPRGIYGLYKFCQRFSIDLIHAHLPQAMIVGRTAGKIAGVPVISTHHNVRDNYQIVSRTLEQWTRGFDRQTVVVSEGVRESFSGYTADWTTIHNGIDTEEFARRVRTADTDCLLHQYKLENDVVYLNIARYAPQKRQLDLIAAMDQLDAAANAHLLVVGWGELEVELKKEVHNRGLQDQITITGHVPSVEPYYSVADVFVSASEREGLPITFLEAMAAELPIVATDIPGVREVVANGRSGLLTPPNQPSVLAAEMGRMLDDSIRTNMGEEGFKIVKTSFSIEESVREYIELYRRLVPG